MMSFFVFWFIAHAPGSSPAPWRGWTWHTLIDYMGQASGILWFFLPKTLTLTVLALVIGIEVIIRAFMIFLWVYNHLKQ